MKRLQNVSALLPLAVLALVGSLVLIAMPAGDKPAVSHGGSTSPQIAQNSLLGASGGSTSQAQAQATLPTRQRLSSSTPAQPTATVAPTPTDTPAPAPTATPIPPTPTATPTWHTQGSYSGSAVGAFATFSNPGSQIRIDWTCQDTAQLPTWQIAFEVQHYAGEGETCQPGQTSGSFVLTPIPQQSVTLDVSGGCQGTGCPPIGPWTATVYVWY